MWFIPDSRAGNEQKTCGKPSCRQKWHKKRCSQWNRKNKDYFRANYLYKKLSRLRCKSDNIEVLAPRPRLNLELPRLEIQAAIGAQQLVIIEYMVQLLYLRFQEAIRLELIVNKGRSP